MDNKEEWIKLVNNVIAEQRRGKDPLIKNLANLGIPNFKKNFNAESFWTEVINTLVDNGYDVSISTRS